MAEISKKRARKTKLVPRDCADIEEEAQSSIVHLQVGAILLRNESTQNSLRLVI